MWGIKWDINPRQQQGFRFVPQKMWGIKCDKNQILDKKCEVVY